MMIKRDKSSASEGLWARSRYGIAASLIAFLAVFWAGCSQGTVPGKTSNGKNGSEEATAQTKMATPVSVQTVLDSETIRAGKRLGINCYLKNDEGKRVVADGDNGFRIASDADRAANAASQNSDRSANTDGSEGSEQSEPRAVEPKLKYAPESNFDSAGGLALTATTTGTGSIACAFPSLGLVDQTPAEVEIEAGKPHTTVAEVEGTTMEAGTTTKADCHVFDKYGNSVSGQEAMVELDTVGGGIVLNQQEGRISVETAGVYMAFCQVDGTAEQIPDSFEVVPGAPTSFAMSVVPERQTYSFDQVVTIETEVMDDYGNSIERVPVSCTMSPSKGADPFGRNGGCRYSFSEEGSYTLTATVETGEDGPKLQEKQKLKVNELGPKIECHSPAEGDVVDIQPGRNISFKGRVSDEHDLDGSVVQVNGKQIPLKQNGGFKASLKTRYGVNFVTIDATDALGKQNTKTCAFVVSNNWKDRSNFLADATTLRLDENGIDDGRVDDPEIDSLNDVFQTVLNSQGTKDAIDQQLESANPLANDPKTIYLGERKLSQQIHTSSIELTPDGLEFDIEINKPEFRFKTNTGWPFKWEKGWLKMESIHIVVDSKLELSRSHQPELKVDQIESVELDDVEVVLDSGFVNWVAHTFMDVDGEARKSIRDAIKNFNRGHLNDQLASVISGLGINALDFQFEVSTVDNSGKLGVKFNFRMSSVKVNRRRVLFGLGTKFKTVVRRPGQARVPMPPGRSLRDPSTNQSLAAGVYGGMLNQALFSLWKAGFFDLSLIGDRGALVRSNAVPEGTEASVSTTAPPVVRVVPNADKKIDIMLGGVHVKLNHPKIGGGGFRLRAGAVLRTQVELGADGSSLEYSIESLPELHVSPQVRSLNPETRQTLKSFVRDMFTEVVKRSLNGAVPALPIPGFTLPNSMNDYGLPGGATYGLAQPSLITDQPHLILDSSFGKQ